MELVLVAVPSVLLITLRHVTVIDGMYQTITGMWSVNRVPSRPRPLTIFKTRAFVVVVLDAELPMNVFALATTTRRRSDTARLLERGQYGGEAILISVSLTSALAGAS